VQIRYQEIIDIKNYEPKIQKLLDDHVIAEPAQRIIEPVNINDPSALQRVVAEQGISQASKADRIASATKRTITENMELDPAFYKRFSELLKETIAAYRARRLSEMAYLKQVMDIAHKVVNKEQDNDIPKSVKHDADAIAFYGILLPFLTSLSNNGEIKTPTADIAQRIVKIIRQQLIINIWTNDEAIGIIQNNIDDYFFDEVRDKMGFNIEVNVLDEIQRQILRTAKARFPQ
jgi:type I restriction enzyme, R subunit